MSEKILIIHSGGIGDLLLALPAMRSFRQAFPHSVLELLGRPERLALVSHDLGATSIHSIDQTGMAYLYLEDSSLPPRLSTFFGSFQAVLVFGKTGARVLADNLKRTGIERVIMIPSFPPENLRAHVSHYLSESLRNNGIGVEIQVDSLRLSGETRIFEQSFQMASDLKEGERVLAIHPGSGSPGKNWAPENFAAVADWASLRSRVLLIFGPADGGALRIMQILKKTKPVIADQLSLIQLASVLKFCTAYVGNDSGITHLAAVLGIPTVAIFVATDPLVWGPVGARVKIIRDQDGCSPRPQENQSEWGHQCLSSVRPEQVIEALAPFLK